ncbi:MAG: hypothetical protein R3E13_05490 [Alphaproteobacteria bacterium]
MSSEGMKDKADKNSDQAVQVKGAPNGGEGALKDGGAKSGSGNQNGSRMVSFQDKAEIDCEKPLPLYNAGPNQAYRAYSKDSSRTPLIAIVCERHVIPRRNVVETYAGLPSANIIRLVGHGVVYWPPANRELYVFIYMDNLGKPLLKPGDKAALGWKQDEVMSVVVRSIVDVFQDFRDKEFVHGNINPYNMFDGVASGKASKVILGECLSTPSSFMQSALYEPIPRAMADPAARGKGTMADDLYAFGASVAVMMRHSDPMAGLSGEEVVRQKVLYGSYGAITGKDRFKGEILELLRGLLHDDPVQRWTIDEVLNWLDGQRLSPKQSGSVKKASRSFVLGESRYFVARLMAMDVEKHVKDLKKSIEDDSLLNWVERSLEDEEVSERFGNALVMARQQSSGSGHESCLAGNISIALDPEAPLRFKGVRLLGNGIGSALAEATALKKPTGVYAEVFLNSLAINWLNVQNSALIDVASLFSKFERCRRYLKTSKYGQGIERVLYSLCPESPCLSSAVESYYVVEPSDLLRAYEDLCQKGRAPSTFLDAHVVSFLSEKDQKVIEPYVYDLNTHESHRVITATLKCFAAIQRRYNTGYVPGIAKAMAPRLQTAVRRYHDRRVQEKLKGCVAEFQSTGDLVKVAALFEDVEISKKDTVLFRNAMQEFQAMEKERQMLEEKLQSKETFGIGAGKEISVMVSSALAFLIIIVTVFMFLSDKSVF